MKDYGILRCPLSHNNNCMQFCAAEILLKIYSINQTGIGRLQYWLNKCFGLRYYFNRPQQFVYLHCTIIPVYITKMYFIITLKLVFILKISHTFCECLSFQYVYRIGNSGERSSFVFVLVYDILSLSLQKLLAPLI